MTNRSITDVQETTVRQSERNAGAATEALVVPYDQDLLERVRIQWQFGDWQSLCRLTRDAILHHPDRAKLALSAAAGRLQMGQGAEAQQFIRLAQDWGASRQLISQILIAGVHNSLGRAAALGNQQGRAIKHFEKSITVGTPGSDLKLLTQARMGEQFGQLGFTATSSLPSHHAGLTAHNALISTAGVSSGETIPLDGIREAWQIGNWAYLAKLDNADIVTSPLRADLALYAACGYQQLDDMDGLQRCTRLALDWGCSRQRLKKFLAAGIRNTLAVSEALAGQFESAASSFVAALTVGNDRPKNQVVRQRIRSQLKTLKNIDFKKIFESITSHLN